MQRDINDSCESRDIESKSSIHVLTYDLMLKNQNIDFNKCKTCTNNKTKILNCTTERKNLFNSISNPSDSDLQNIATLQSKFNCLGLCESHKGIRCDFINGTSKNNSFNICRTDLFELMDYYKTIILMTGNIGIFVNVINIFSAILQNFFTKPIPKRKKAENYVDSSNKMFYFNSIIQ